MRATAGAIDTISGQSAPGRGDQLLRAMTETLARQHPASAAEALQALRRGYPEIPLALRIAALCAAK